MPEPDPMAFPLATQAAALPASEAATLRRPPFTRDRPVRGRRRRARPAPRAVDAAAALVGLGLGAVIAMAIDAETAGALRAAGGWATFGGRLAGLTGAYLLLVVVLLTGRVPFV